MCANAYLYPGHNPDNSLISGDVNRLLLDPLPYPNPIPTYAFVAHTPLLGSKHHCFRLWMFFESNLFNLL
jgi:hypothetical protein